LIEPADSGSIQSAEIKDMILQKLAVKPGPFFGLVL
jgi:hypothetical protein